MEPSQVKFVVYCARGLKGKKAGRCKFSVIFGLGSSEYRTTVVKDPNGSPNWNEEALVKVKNASDYAFFTVTDKEDVLGQIVVPIASLPTSPGVIKRAPLRPHKKCPVPQGELIYQCYVVGKRPVEQSQSRSNSLTANSRPQPTGFARLRQKFTHSSQSPYQPPRKGTKSSSLSNFNTKLSNSIHNIFSFGKSSENDLKSTFRSFSINANLDKAGDIPIINSITPNSDSIEGGTRLVIDGKNLGLGKSDIVELVLCGCDLLDSVEFESANRIYCTTKATTAGKGDLWLETISGGQTVVRNVFTFIDKTALLKNRVEQEEDSVSVESGGISFTAKSEESPASSVLLKRKENPAVCNELNINQASKYSSASLSRTTDNSSVDGPGRYLKKNIMKHIRHSSESILAKEQENVTVAELKSEIVKLQDEKKDLRDRYSALQAQNGDMKKYIEHLLDKVIQHCPEILETNPPRF